MTFRLNHDFCVASSAGRLFPHWHARKPTFWTGGKPVGEAHNDLSDDSHLDDINDLLPAEIELITTTVFPFCNNPLATILSKASSMVFSGRS